MRDLQCFHEPGRPLGSVNCLRGRRRPHLVVWPCGLCLGAWVCFLLLWFCSARDSCLCNRGCSESVIAALFFLGVVELSEEPKF